MWREAAQPARPRPAGPIVRAEEAALWSRADDMLRAADECAVLVIQKAVEDADEARARAFAEGRDEGRAAAAAEAIALARLGRRQLAQWEAELPDLVVRILEDVLGQFDRDELVSRSIAAALEKYRTVTDLVIQVGRDDVLSADRALSAIGDGRDQVVRIEVEPGMSPGRCLLKGGFGAIDISIETQIKALGEGLAAASDNAGAPAAEPAP